MREPAATELIARAERSFASSVVYSRAMANRSGRALALLIVAMIGVAVWWRFRGRGGDEASPKLVSTDASVAVDAVAVREPPVDVERIVADAAIEPVRRRFKESEFRIVGLSLDGKRALLHRDSTWRNLATPSYRVFTVDTGKLEAEVELPTFKLGQEPVPGDDERATDVLRAGPLLRDFPLGAGGTIAVSPDGKSAAFNIGDPLHVVLAGKRRKLPFPAAYDPMILADGQTLLFRGYDGRVAGPESEGKYSLFWMSLDGGKPQKVPATETTHGWRLSRSGDALRIVVGDSPTFAPCVLEVPLVKPLKVTRKRCVDHGEIQMSPAGDWLGWTSPLATDEPATFGEGTARLRSRTIEFATGNLGFDVSVPGWFTLADTGRAVFELGVVRDLVNGRARELPLASATSCVFRGGSELVCVDGDSVAVIDLDAR